MQSTFSRPKYIYLEVEVYTNMRGNLCISRHTWTNLLHGCRSLQQQHVIVNYSTEKSEAFHLLVSLKIVISQPAEHVYGHVP